MIDKEGVHLNIIFFGLTPLDNKNVYDYILLDTRLSFDVKKKACNHFLFVNI